jgi:Ca2+-binding RTX toxin-like protein
LGDDIIQGDGFVGVEPVDDFGAVRDQSGVLHISVSTLNSDTDGNDYVEGGDGRDVIFGNLGQDDLVGGNSSLFGLDNSNLRGDTSDMIFGGAGLDVERNHMGGAHVRDADVIIGDNGNIYRLVDRYGSFMEFVYDSKYEGKIIPRAAELLDYTLGGLDFSATTAKNDIGGSDEIHGESGDDVIYGMLGDDILFGEGQDDDLIGGGGHDWISGGTGQDGILGDDGRIFTSRDSVRGEPLYGVAGVGSDELDFEILVVPGQIPLQSVTYVTGLLNKTAHLTPSNLDPYLISQDPEFDAQYANDIVFGGWGNDFLHGGAGDDALSGAEAMPVYYSHPYNSGDVLGYGIPGSEGKFAAYDEDSPLAKIRVDDTGAYTYQGDVPFILNFDAGEGPDDPYASVVQVDPVPTDGDDVIFGNLGNDWLVGGSGRDYLYGGWGNDLLNADDDHDTTKETLDPFANNVSDEHPSYEDLAYGGEGRDVIIGNTQGDELVDWSSQSNSYIVPFSPFLADSGQTHDILDSLIINNGSGEAPINIYSDLDGSQDAYLRINSTGAGVFVGGSILMAGDIRIDDGLMIQATDADTPLVIHAGAAGIQPGSLQKIIPVPSQNELFDGLASSPTFSLKLEWMADGILYQGTARSIGIAATEQEVESALNSVLSEHSNLSVTVTRPETVKGVVPNEWIISFGEGFESATIHGIKAEVDALTAPYLEMQSHDLTTQWFSGELQLGRGEVSLIQGNEDTIDDHLHLVSQTASVAVDAVVGGDYLLGNLSASALRDVNFDYDVTIAGDFSTQTNYGMTHLRGDVTAGGSLSLLGDTDLHGDRRLIAGAEGVLGGLTIGSADQVDSLTVGGNLVLRAGNGGQIDVHTPILASSDVQALTIEEAGDVTFHENLIVAGDVIIHASGVVTFKGGVNIGSGGSFKVLGASAVVFEGDSSGVALSGVNAFQSSGDIVLEADSWTLSPSQTISGAGMLSLRPATLGLDIYLGQASDLVSKSGWLLTFESLNSFVGKFHTLKIGQVLEGKALDSAGDLELLGTTGGDFPRDLDVALYGRGVRLAGSTSTTWDFAQSLELNAHDTLSLETGIVTTGDLILSSDAGKVVQSQGGLVVGGNLSLATQLGFELTDTRVSGLVQAVNRGEGSMLLSMTGSNGLSLEQLGEGIVSVSVPSGDLTLTQIQATGQVSLAVSDGDILGQTAPETPQITAQGLQLLINGSAGSLEQPLRLHVDEVGLSEVTSTASEIVATNSQDLLVESSGALGSLWLDVAGDLQLTGRFDLSGNLGVKSQGDLQVTAGTLLTLQGDATAIMESLSGSIHLARGGELALANGDAMVKANTDVVLDGRLIGSANIGLVALGGEIKRETAGADVAIQSAGLFIDSGLGVGNDLTLTTQVQSLAATIATGALHISEADDLVVDEVTVQVNAWEDFAMASSTFAMSGVNSESQELFLPVETVTQTISLTKGWNQIAIGLDTGSQHVSDLFGDRMSHIKQIITGNRIFDPRVPAFLNTLDTLKVGEGLWIETSEPIEAIEITGLEISAANIELNAGWNFVGLPIMEERSLAEAGSSLESWEKVSRITDGNRNYLPTLPTFLNTLSVFEPGQAYWIEATGTTQWKIGRDAGTHDPAPLGYLFMDVNGSLMLNQPVMTRGDVYMSASEVGFDYNGSNAVISARELWVETNTGFGASSSPIVTQVERVAGHFGVGGYYMSNLTDLKVSVLGLSASAPASGDLKISVLDGNLTLVGTLGSRDGITLDVLKGGLVDLETQSATGILVIDGNIRSAAQGVDAYSHQALVYNQGLRSGLSDSIREQGPRN